MPATTDWIQEIHQLVMRRLGSSYRYIFLVWPCFHRGWFCQACTNHPGLLNIYPCQFRIAVWAWLSGRNKQHHRDCNLHPPDPLFCGQGHRGNTIFREVCVIAYRSLWCGMEKKLTRRLCDSLCVVHSTAVGIKNSDYWYKIVGELINRKRCKIIYLPIINEYSRQKGLNRTVTWTPYLWKRTDILRSKEMHLVELEPPLAANIKFCLTVQTNCEWKK